MEISFRRAAQINIFNKLKSAIIVIIYHVFVEKNVAPINFKNKVLTCSGNNYN